MSGEHKSGEQEQGWVVHHALGTTAHLGVTDPDALGVAEAVLLDELAAIDAACSRFRPDSEISEVHAEAGRGVVVAPLLAEAITVALRAAELTNGMVDPTVGKAVRDLGYDRDFAELGDTAGRQGGRPCPRQDGGASAGIPTHAWSSCRPESSSISAQRRRRWLPTGSP